MYIYQQGCIIRNNTVLLLSEDEHADPAWVECTRNRKQILRKSWILIGSHKTAVPFHISTTKGTTSKIIIYTA